MNTPRLRSLALSIFIGLLLLGKTTVASAQDAEAPKTLFGDFLKDHDIEVTASGTIDYYSRYVWRGQYLDRDNVIQPGFSFTVKGFTIGYWANFDMENKDSLPAAEGLIEVLSNCNKILNMKCRVLKCKIILSIIMPKNASVCNETKQICNSCITKC